MQTHTEKCNLKQLFPNSFIKYLGKRKAIVTLQGLYNTTSVRKLSGNSEIGIGECKYIQANDTTLVEITRLSVHTPFLIE